MNAVRSRWSTQTKLVIGLLLLALFVYLLFRFSNLLIPLVIAVILAFILSPLANLFQNRFRLRRILATAVCHLLYFGCGDCRSGDPLLAAGRWLEPDVQRWLGSVEAFLDHQYLIAGQASLAALFRQVVISFREY
jgi:thiol:disulfide interchange protein